MKISEILNQAAEIVCRTKTMVENAHQLLRNDDINQAQFIEIKDLEVKAQRLYRKLENESR